MATTRFKSRAAKSLEPSGPQRMKRQADDLEDDRQPEPTPKRKKTKEAASDRMKQVDQLTRDADIALGVESSSSKGKGKAPASSPAEDKRQRMWRKKPSQRYLEKLERASTQRMFVIGRKREGTEEDPKEVFTVVGTVGNVYEIIIGKLLSCTCPDHQNGNHCKHVVYVMNRILKAREDFQYQVALLSTELREIFGNAPPSPIDIAKTDDDSGQRKPVEGDCPVCFTSFEPDENEIVWCRAACGNNIHKACFDQWAASTRSRGVTCVYCRTPWQKGSAEEILKSGTINQEGYVNVAAEYGLSGRRDYSSYHQFWVQQQMRRRHH